MTIKLECCLADVCLPDYWSGHHKPHCQILVWHGMKLKEIKQALKYELSGGMVAGADYDSQCDKWHNAAIAAVNRICGAFKGQRTFFRDLEENDEDADHEESIYAFFVFMEL